MCCWIILAPTLKMRPCNIPRHECLKRLPVVEVVHVYIYIYIYIYTYIYIYVQIFVSITYCILRRRWRSALFPLATTFFAGTTSLLGWPYKRSAPTTRRGSVFLDGWPWFTLRKTHVKRSCFLWCHLCVLLRCVRSGIRFTMCSTT